MNARPVFSLQLGTKTMIILSSDFAVKEVLDKRSGNYSDRPDMFIGQRVASRWYEIGRDGEFGAWRTSLRSVLLIAFGVLIPSANLA